MFYIISCIILFNIIYNIFFYKKDISNISVSNKNNISDTFNTNYLDTSIFLFIGKCNNQNMYLNEKALYQNILITGAIGSGKTSSAMYPFTKQLITYFSSDSLKKIGMLILDVKGNYYKEVYKYCQLSNRLNDLIIIELGGKYKYNPLDKPDLNPSVLANRLKTILLLFSKNNSESYWLDKVEQILTECIKLCRLYNQNYVTFKEIHNLTSNYDYYLEKINSVKQLFLSNSFNIKENYNLLSSLSFLEDEYWKLDNRTLSILKSEITRITSMFVSDYDVYNTFCPERTNVNFSGFTDLIENGKIVVLNMNISEYKNISKIIGAYLKLDFQSEVLAQLSKSTQNRTVAFICDEYHEYVTDTDADFFAQSREAKCINILSTQSYSSLLNTLQNETTLRVLLQNLVNKFWFRTDDIYTIENIQKQLGKEEKEKFSKTISENANNTYYNYFTKSFYSNKSNISESINQSIQFDYIYDTNFFSKDLQTFSCLSFISNGSSILPPHKLTMLPYFNERSFYEKK